MGIITSLSVSSFRWAAAISERDGSITPGAGCRGVSAIHRAAFVPCRPTAGTLAGLGRCGEPLRGLEGPGNSL